MSGGGEVGGKLRPKNFRGWGGEGKARPGNMADCLLGPSASPSFHLCSSCKPKTSHLSLSHFPLVSLSPMATFRSSSLNHCRCSSNSNPSQPSLLVFSGFTFTHSLSLSLSMFLFTTTTTTTTTISDSVQVGLRLTVWWKSLRISRLVSPMFFLFPMTEEAPLRLFVSSVNSFFFF